LNTLKEEPSQEDNTIKPVHCRKKRKKKRRKEGRLRMRKAVTKKKS
jgi:hypothetical protein